MKQKNSSEEYITKKYLDERFSVFAQSIRRETQFIVDTAIEKLENRLRQTNDKLFNMLDKIVKELEGMREDRIIGDHQAKQVRQQVDNHEKRIKRLEVRQTA
ncbi:MAG: hypothetical protein HYV39_00795 [Candidatus Levybacteria bacterium]|nr:hypothetical protein [Candidatus Levybacteria bacterium]